MHFLKLFCSKN